MKNILIIRLSSLGDIILTTPLIKALKELYPESQIDYCTKSEYAEAIKFNPNINSIIEADNNLTFASLRSLKKKLRRNKYDLVVDAHNKLSTFYLRTFLNGEKLVFRKYSFRKFLIVKFKINLMKDLPSVTERYLRMLGGKSFNNKTEIFEGAEAVSKVEDFLNKIDSTGKNLICIFPLSKHFTKTYPAELYAELINKFDKDKFIFLLTGKGSDKSGINKIKSLTGNNVFNECDKFSITELASLVKKCKLVISGDTGPMHIAEALNVPLIMLSGPSVKEFGFYPQSDNALVLEVQGLNCRPCSHIGRDSCPKGHFKCMKDIRTDEIYSAANKLLSF